MEKPFAKPLLVVCTALLLLAIVPAVAAAQCYLADPNDNTPDTAYLQDCLDGGGTVALERGSPGYIINGVGSQGWGLILWRPGTILTSVDDEKVLFKAHPDLIRPMLITDGDPDNFEMSNLVFDGDKDNRNYGSTYCTGNRGLRTHNLTIYGSDFTIHHVDSINALCGSALEVNGEYFEVYSGYFANNGYSGDQSNWDEPWGDGITVTYCGGGYIHNNDIVDNTDIGLVIGQGFDCWALWNNIEQVDQYTFVGFHVGAFQVPDIEHENALYQYNQIDSAQDKMAAGIFVGDRPWRADHTIYGEFEVIDNEVNGAVVALSIDGIDAGTITDNGLYNAQGTAGLFGCTYSGLYTAADYGSATIQSGSVTRHYHQGSGCFT